MTKTNKSIILDKFENEILESYENGKLKPSKLKTDFQTIAKNTMKKNRKINTIISENCQVSQGCLEKLA